MSSLIGGAGGDGMARTYARLDLGKLADVAARRVPEHIEQRLARNMDVDGNTFAPLDADTLRQRSTSGRGAGQVLQGAPFEVRELSREVHDDRLEVTFGASTPELRRIGAYHQHGEGNLPERRWAGVSREGLRELMDRALREGLFVVDKQPGT